MDGDPTMSGGPRPLHDASGRFARGNPGRRKGSRNRMTNQLALGLLDDFALNEAANIETMRRWYFPQYVQLMARFIPREAARPRPDFADYAPEETARVLAAARMALEAAERGEAGLDALLEVLEQDPATLEPPAEAVGEDISNDVNYVESTSPPAPPAPIDDNTLKGWPLRRNE
jgi:hypothetical protein